tara:strand:- start:923 stop:2035 length:1113 start_codon:yes stop_codon:yes gene_type:complete
MNIKIPWAKPEIGMAEYKQVKDVFYSNKFTMGNKVKLFEKNFSKQWGSKYAIAVSNGTVALDIALKSIDIKFGDEVIVPAISYISTASSVSYQGAIPVFVDINDKNFGINIDKIEASITKKTKAIIYIDYGGFPLDFKRIRNIAKNYNLHLILDGAQTLGSKYKDKYIGHNGIISTISLHMAKIITTTEGGMIFTNDRKIHEKIKTIRNIGEPENKKYEHTTLGTNARMTEIQAGIGIEQLKKLDDFVIKRNKVAEIYKKLFRKYNLNLQLPVINTNYKSSYFFFPILIKNRDYIKEKLLKSYGIDTRIAYPKPIFEQKLYLKKKFPNKFKDCNFSIKFSKQILNLPIFPSMKIKEIEYVVRSIRELMNE